MEGRYILDAQTDCNQIKSCKLISLIYDKSKQFGHWPKMVPVLYIPTFIQLDMHSQRTLEFSSKICYKFYDGNSWKVDLLGREVLICCQIQ